MRKITYPLVEGKRPPLYTSMKYWGKKPHNIWNEYISKYTKRNGNFLDPFCGSGMSAFESVLEKKNTFAFDLNPLTSFVIEVVSSKYNEREFHKSVERIVDAVFKDPIFNKLYLYKENKIVHNVKWSEGKIYEVCVINNDKSRECLEPDDSDFYASSCINYSDIDHSYPNYEFRNAISFTSSFLKQIGNKYYNIFTPRNLYVLSLIFDLILNEKNEVIKKQLLYGFIQTVHLSTKMCVPRGKKSNRDFSTSWGRSAYISSKKQMEMNPLLLFKNNCIGKQSVESVMKCALDRYHNKLKIADITKKKYDEKSDIDIWYGIIDAKRLSSYIPKHSIDFILTDPPYGGLIQYLDLSSIWLAWLSLYDSKYNPDYSSELTVGFDKNTESFSNEFSKVLKELFYVLKDDGKLVITFNNKNIDTWNGFICAIYSSGFKIEDVIHQPNKRSGESNVDDPNGVASSDFYIHCTKGQGGTIKKIPDDELKALCYSFVKEIITTRNEPTPKTILFNAYIKKLALSGVEFNSQLCDLDKVLVNNKVIEYKNTVNRAGNFYWLNEKKYNKNSKKNLTIKFDEFIKNVFSSIDNISCEELLNKIYRKFNGNLAIDIETINAIIALYAFKKDDMLIRRK